MTTIYKDKHVYYINKDDNLLRYKDDDDQYQDYNDYQIKMRLITI